MLKTALNPDFPRFSEKAFVLESGKVPVLVVMSTAFASPKGFGLPLPSAPEG